MKRFNLVLDDDLYEEWCRYYGKYGIRQTVLRRIVWIMVNRAKIKAGHVDKKPPLWHDDWENMTLAQIVAQVTEEVTKYGNY